MGHTKIRMKVLTGALLLASLIIPYKSLQAGPGAGIAPQTCDTRVWQTMENRARMETEREIMQNQNLIFKADSVLAYTCFDSFAAHASRYAGVLFTHTSYFGGLIIPWGAPNGMDTAMQSVVINSLNPYLNSNFNHNPLGGRGSSLSLSRYAVNPIGSQGRTYACDQMARIWSTAKCLNFMHTSDFANTDGFYPFKNLTGANGGPSIQGYQTKNDVRNFPTACSGQPIEGGWLQIANSSRNSADGTTYNRYYPYSTPNNQAFTDVREMVRAGECGPPVRTGVQVIVTSGAAGGGGGGGGGAGGGGGGTTRPDAVCTNPGCTYVGNNCTTGGAPAGGGAPPLLPGGPF
jgi:hypothetical protein